SCLLRFFLRLFASPNGSNKLTQPRNRTHDFSNGFIADLFASISDGFAGYALHLPYAQSHRHHLAASAHNPPHREPAPTSSRERCWQTLRARKPVDESLYLFGRAFFAQEIEDNANRLFRSISVNANIRGQTAD